MKLKLSTKFTKSIVSKLVSKAVSKKLGLQIDIQFNDLDLLTNEDRVLVHADLNGEISKEDLAKILKSLGLD